MFESVKYSKCTTKEFLDTLIDVDEIYAEYEKKNGIYIECLDRLCYLKEFSLCIKILVNQSKQMLDNFEKYEQLCNILSRSLQDFKNHECLDKLLSFFWDLLEKCTELFQKYLVCRIISTIVAFEGKFPNKTRAISYFKVLYEIFEKSECFNNYLVVVYYMEKLGVVDLSEEEIYFLNACVNIKREEICKELLCGMRQVDVQNVFKNRKGGNKAFIKNKNWEKLIEIKETGNSVPLDVDFVSFLLKNDINFEIKNGELYVGEYCGSKLSGRIFAIAKKYEIKKEIIVKSIISEEVSEESVEKESVEKNIKKIKEEESVTLTKYIDRFSKPRREFKWFYSNCGYVFEDNGLEERNDRRKKIFEETNQEFKRKKQIFEEKKLVYQLSEKLKVIVEEKTKKEREETMKRLKEQSLTDSTENLWDRKRIASPKVDNKVGSTSTCSSVITNSFEDIRNRRLAMASAASSGVSTYSSVAKNEVMVKKPVINKFNEELKNSTDSNLNSRKSKWERNIKK